MWSSGSDLCRCEGQDNRQRRQHCSGVVVPVGLSLLLQQLGLPSRQDLVALEALANTGQSLIELRAVGSEKGQGKKQSGSELLRIRRPSDRFKLRDLHDQRFGRLVSRLQAQLPVDRGFEFASVRCIRHLTHVVSKAILPSVAALVLPQTSGQGPLLRFPRTR